MIASKPVPSAPLISPTGCEREPLLQHEEDAPALPLGIFQGLSFPDAPTNIPTFPAKGAGLQNKVWGAEAKPAPEEAKTILVASEERRLEPVATHTDASEKADLSSLYATMEAPITTQTLYPSLPPLTVGKTVSKPPAYEHCIVGSVSNEPASSYSLERVQSSTHTHTHTHASPKATSTSGSDQIVQELLDENSRLMQELEDLRASMRLASEEENAAAGIRSSSDEDVAAVTAQTGSSTHAGDQTRAGTESGRVKYVCCGSCNQWLQAPIEKTLVYCPSCSAVNDCTAAERRNREQGQGQQPAARRLQSAPWYRQCFVNAFGTN